ETLRGVVRTVQAVSLFQKLLTCNWCQVVGTTTRADTQVGTCYSGFAAVDPANYGNGSKSVINSGILFSPWLVQASPYFYSTFGPFNNNPVTASIGPVRMDSRWPNAYWVGTQGITIDKIISKIAAVAQLGYTSGDANMGFGLWAQKPNAATACYPIDVATGPYNATEMWVNVQCFFGFHPIDGMGGNITLWGIYHVPCRCISNVDIGGAYNNTLAEISDLGPPTVPFYMDGKVLNFGDRVLLAGQSNKVQNGIYVFTNPSPGTGWKFQRASDFTNLGGVTLNLTAQDEYVLVYDGVTNGGTNWHVTSLNPSTGDVEAWNPGVSLLPVTPASFSAPNIWNNPAAFGYGDSLDKVLQAICFFLCCDYSIEIEQV